MFKVISYIRIQCSYGSSSRDPILQHIINLPFAPFPGLEVCDGDWSVIAKEVSWDVKEQAFQIWSEDDRQIYNRLLQQKTPPTQETIDAVVADYLETGWERAT